MCARVEDRARILMYDVLFLWGRCGVVGSWGLPRGLRCGWEPVLGWGGMGDGIRWCGMVRFSPVAMAIVLLLLSSLG